MSRKFEATLLALDGTTLSSRTTSAWNSAVRASEDLVRTLARSEGMHYHGDKPMVLGGIPAGPGAIYARIWTSSRLGRIVRVNVKEVFGA